jgi:hypothetical protein
MKDKNGLSKKDIENLERQAEEANTFGNYPVQFMHELIDATLEKLDAVCMEMDKPALSSAIRDLVVIAGIAERFACDFKSPIDQVTFAQTLPVLARTLVALGEVDQ